MRVTRAQIINGLGNYINQELLPKMGGDKAMQIALDVGVRLARTNDRMTDVFFSRDAVKAILADDGSGYYEIGGLMDALRASVQEHGAFPIAVQPIPWILPQGSTITLHAADIDAIRRKIEGVEGGDGHA